MMPFYTVIFSLDTAIYASGDVLADTQLVHAGVGHTGRDAFIDSVQIEDDDDQGGALDLIFLKSNVSLGAENSAANISDADVAAAVLGQVVVAAADYVDYGGARVALKTNLSIPLPAVADLYLGAISRDAKTYSAAGIRVRIGIAYR